MLKCLAAAVGWNPKDAFEGVHEPPSEGVRMLLLDEVQQILERLRNMTTWLQALDPALQAKVARPGGVPLEEHRRLRGARPSPKSRRAL